MSYLHNLGAKLRKRLEIRDRDRSFFVYLNASTFFAVNAERKNDKKVCAIDTFFSDSFGGLPKFP